MVVVEAPLYEDMTLTFDNRPSSCLAFYFWASMDIGQNKLLLWHLSGWEWIKILSNYMDLLILDTWMDLFFLNFSKIINYINYNFHSMYIICLYLYVCSVREDFDRIRDIWYVTFLGHLVIYDFINFTNYVSLFFYLTLIVHVYV